EFLSELGILCRDADGAGVEVTHAHHDAAACDQRRGAEADLFGAEQERDRDIAARFDLAIGLENDAPAQTVHYQDLLRLGDAHFPGNAGVFDAGKRTRAGSTRVTADEDV